MLLIVLAVVGMLCLSGCSSPPEATLLRDRITLCVGESRDILPYIEFKPSAATDRRVRLRTESDCVAVSGTTVTALSQGDAVVAVITDNGRAEITVTVAYASIADVSVEVSGSTVQSVAAGESPKRIGFTVELGENVDPATEVLWRVNGESKGDGRAFEFTPVGIGEYMVTAVVGDTERSTAVTVYRKTETTVTYTGVLDQTDGNFSPVTFTAKERVYPHNPRSVYEWRVNGVPSGYEEVFAFTPSAGEYYIALSVNGYDVDKFTVTASGARTPRGEIEFESTGKVYAVWRDGGYIARASVFAPNGRRVDLDVHDAQCAYRFGAGRVELTDIVEVCAENPAKYRIELEADGVYSFEFEQLPLSAKTYVDEKVLCGNSYLGSERDCGEWVRELYACGIADKSAYVACDKAKAAAAVESAAKALDMTAQTEFDGNVMHVTLGGLVNAPAAYGKIPEVTAMYSVVPHIEYRAENRRPQDYVFAADRTRGGVEVENSEQLLLAVERGVTPLPVKDSPAEKIYAAAKAALLSIIGADYTDEQKVHAVYDWLQWVTVRAESAEKTDCAEFAEGVFGSPYITAPSGMRRCAVTSAGAAKVFSLMCGIEGIECIINRTETPYGARFHNKVRVASLWYNVDVFGGDISSSELGISRVSEMTSHRGLLIDDGTARTFGLLPLGGEYEAFHTGMTYYTRSNADTGAGYVNFYIGREDLNESTVTAVLHRAFDANTGSFSVPLPGSIEIYSGTTYGCELFCDIDEKQWDTLYGMIEKAVGSYGAVKLGPARAYRVGNVLQIAASGTGI